MHTLSSRLNILALLSLIALPLAASEWDSTWAGDTAPDTSSSQSNYYSAAPSAGESSWVSDDRGGLTRLSSSGAVLTHVPGNGVRSGAIMLRNLADGGALRLSSFYVSRIDALGRTVWSFFLFDVFQSLPSDSSALMKMMALDDNGAMWLIDRSAQRLHKVAPDGHFAFTLTPADLNLTRIEAVAVSPDGTLALVVGKRGEGGAAVIATVRLSHDGSVLSSWTGPNAIAEGQVFYGAAVISPQHAIAVTFDSQANLVFAHHDAQGNVAISQNPQFRPSGLSIEFIRATSTGVVIGSNNFIPISSSWDSLGLYTPFGEQVYMYEFPNFSPLQQLMEAADGSLWARTLGSDGGFGPVTPGELTRLSAVGATRVALPNASGSPVVVSVTPDSNAAIVALGTSHYRVNASGQTELGVPRINVKPMTRAMATTDSEGNSYVIQRLNSTDSSSEGATINKIARDGSRIWSKPVLGHVRFPTATFPPPINSTHIAANAERVCFYIQSSNFLYCHSASTGDFQARVELPMPAYDMLELSSDNHAVLRRHFGGAAPAAVLDAGNTLVPASAYTAAMLAPRLYSGAGYELYFDGSAATSISSIRRESRVTAAAAPALTWQLGSAHVPAVLPDGQPGVIVLEDGSALLLAYGESAQSPLVLQRLNADGSLGYRKTFDIVSERANLKRVGDRVLVSTYRRPGFLQTGEVRLFGLALADGGTAWQHLISTPADYNAVNTPSDIIVDSDHVHAVWWASDSLDVIAQKFRIGDGALVTRTDLPCAEAFCRLERVLADTHGVTVLPMLSRREPDLFAPRVRADQDVLEGAWYQPLTSGQGVLFDYLPESRTWFGTWHTSDLSGVNSRAGLRWFTLQGQANSEGTQADLGIYVASGGVFDNAPRVGSTRIGDASLKFDSCGSANLEYRITSGELQGSAGSIPLRLLTPHPGTCAALGQTPASAPISERNGISSRYSGTWYQPDTSGQGIEAAIRPELGNGTIVAGWFTFDPQGSADDAQAQHWFTLQGDLSTAANGAVTLPIFRTIGGTFDQNGSRNTVRVGEATWSFQGCNQSQLSYHFDNTDVAGVFAERSGVILLQRLGACAAP
jgi:hypothetical protein